MKLNPVYTYADDTWGKIVADTGRWNGVVGLVKNIENNFNWIKRNVSVILCDPHCKDDNT